MGLAGLTSNEDISGTEKLQEERLPYPVLSNAKAQ